MAKLLFDRQIKVLIGENDSEAVSIEGFKMSFAIRKTESSDPNTCEFKVWNLNVNTRNRVAKLDDFGFVSAGYLKADNVETIFVGNITDIKEMYEPPNVITVISMADGEKSLNKKKVSVSYGKGSQALQILKDLVKKSGLDLKTPLEKLGINKVYNTGFSHTGTVQQAIRKVSEYSGLDWSVQNEQLKFTLEGQSDESRVIIIDSDTGMLGSPQKTKIKDNKRKSKVELDGWKVVSFLQPQAEPQGRIELFSLVTGPEKIFKIIDVEHNGDNTEGDFQTIMTVVEAA